MRQPRQHERMQSDKMGGTILYKGGVERLLPFSRRLGGMWPEHEEVPGSYSSFPEVLLQDRVDLPYRRLAEAGWPCWFAATCSYLYTYCSGQPIEGSEKLAAFHAAMRITGLLGLPIDYTQVRDRYMAKALRLRAELAPETKALKVAALLEAKLRGERYGYELAQEMIDAYRDAIRTYGEQERNKSRIGDIFEDPVMSAKNAMAFLKANELTLSILNACWEDADKELRQLGEPGNWNLRYEIEDRLAAPYVMRGRLMLLEAMRESRVEGPGDDPEPRKDCEGSYCVPCFEDFWQELQTDMTPAERRAIDRERMQAGLRYDWWRP